MNKKNLLNKIFLSWFGLGYAPFISGTFGSIGAIPLCVLILKLNSIVIHISIALIITLLGSYAAGVDQKQTNIKDPKYVVIDEVAGMLWGSLFLKNIENLVLVFIIFRFFDIIKIYPASYFDKLSKSNPSPLKRGFYIVLDDCIAGIQTFIILLLIQTFFPNFNIRGIFYAFT
jgi:phosphatidylglycerophosphatase A